MQHPLFTRLTNWEFWPMWLVYLPVIPYYIWLSLKARSLFFWSNVNPEIEYSGMLGESKQRIMDKVQERWKPLTIYLPKGKDQSFLKREFEKREMTFPVFVKPDIGERGLLAAKLEDWKAVEEHLSTAPPVAWQYQAFLEEPVELAVLHFRKPGATKGEITSVTLKGFLKVEGNGRDSIRDLILSSPRASLQIERLEKEMGERLSQVPQKGEIVSLGVVGNHSLGTEFINANHLIDAALHRVFDEVEQSLEGIFYARYDLKTVSIEALKQGKSLQIMEVNGVGAEPAHIYDTSLSLYKRYQAIFRHYRQLYEIGRIQQGRGIPYMSLDEYFAWRKHLKTYYNLVKS